MATGWLGRATAEMKSGSGGVPILNIGNKVLPLAVAGAPGGAVSVNDQNSFRLEIGGGKVSQQKARRRLLEELSTPAVKSADDDLASFLQRPQVQTLPAVENLRELLYGANAPTPRGNRPTPKHPLID